MTDQANAPDGTPVPTALPAPDLAGRPMAGLPIAGLPIAGQPMAARSFAARSVPAGDAADEAADLREALRRATTDLHRQLDQAPDQRALLQPGLTVERYAAILHTHLHALTITEAALAALEEARPTDLAAYRPRLPALVAELAALATLAPTWAPSQASAPSRRPTPTRPPNQAATRSEPAAPLALHRFTGPVSGTDPALALGAYLGVRYVLEGSTQGAVVILRRLLHYLPERGTHDFGFWRLQADEAPAWRALAEKLTTLPAQVALAASATAAARGTFEVYLQAFGVTSPDRGRAHAPHPGQGPAQR